MKEKTFFSYVAADTEVVGSNMALSLYKSGCRRAFIAMRGEMGVGKTAFARGFCRPLGIKTVHSPTFNVVNEYRSGKIPVFHFDMYRVESEDDLLSIGYEDYLAKDGYVLCEWSENVEDAIPDGAYFVTITRTDAEDGRTIEVIRPDNG
ncbi:MAG: tRNA (adenosine(37)-N6)-threonylcarbamoyltransferase complex ATPase subunit type 1 TsaE [Clostridia bacterium]|nr:tRNA (adenosine(37)-N6)-threonylcarbamoyltransferase complex ATPase subunit type 1 TsaE [Clostridia bacterium]